MAEYFREKLISLEIAKSLNDVLYILTRFQVLNAPESLSKLQFSIFCAEKLKKEEKASIT